VKQIAIIGGGFYGCYIACKLADKNYKVCIYEKKPKPCLGSITNNQNRLHLGYHYPRCEKTITQTIDSFNQFTNEFKQHIRFLHDNIYAVHRDSNVSFEDYCRIFNDFDQLKHTIVKNSDDVWNLIKDKTKFTGALRTLEGVLDCQSIRSQLITKIYTSKNIKLYCNSNISQNKMFEISRSNDFVVNCTYNEPFIAVDKQVLTKDQACLIPVLKNNRYANIGFTIMDGPYCSLYPASGKLFSCSSVLYTPIDSRERKFEVKERLQSIVAHNEEYFYIENSDVVDYYYGIKTKMQNDLKDERYSFVSRQSNIITVFAGKISSVVKSYRDVLNEII